MPQNAFFSTNLRSSGQPKNDAKTLFFFSTHHPLSTVIFATATILAFGLLRSSRFSFHCYTQREATPTQKLARKCAATSRDLLRKRLQSAFTLANQLRWIAQYAGLFCILWLSKLGSGYLLTGCYTPTCLLALSAWRDRPARRRLLRTNHQHKTSSHI